ncbi:hypothetical protein Mal15_48260 [Stieleria maiorica]|uniref:Uncharacterized protein n=1 Tax=Stieleria maiorica TaxID=2795974 RepID=A0A5B9MIK7_9BACT|nr:hypothetical protein [Stieleria maiorica]QEG00754.1 hypothetical protein Mal15_48260 [Stieleria maiorica]
MLALRFLAIFTWVCILDCCADDAAGVPRFEALARLLQAAHTTDLPVVDRVDILAFSFSDPEDDPSDPETETFLVRPASPVVPDGTATIPSPEISVTAHASTVVKGKDAKRIADDWRSLRFQPNGAFCHVPTYGLRFYRDGTVIFSVSICWKCHNFYMPVIDPRTGQASVALYGFDDNAAAKKLLNDLRRLVPHPKIRHPRL